jgi:rubrerythrin
VYALVAQLNTAFTKPKIVSSILVWRFIVIATLDRKFHTRFLKERNTMGTMFNADDIFEMAEQIERNGAKFYREASANVESIMAKQMLLQLSEMEEGHEKIYRDLRAALTADEKKATVFDPLNEAVQYLRALADTRVFFQKAIDLKSMLEILKAAIEAEKDSIVFYTGMKDVVPEGLGKKRIDDIIKEEMGHITLLSKELLALK